MLQLRGDLDLAQESRGAYRGGEVLLEDLDGDLAIVLDVVSEEHRGHAPGADLTVDPVSSGESGLRAVEGRGQGMWGWGLGRR